ncbi:MAG: nucleoside-triphosphatase [Candidatus Hodarchaeota archaeon]
MIIVISGLRGVGKTSLALKLLVELKGRCIRCGGVLTLGQDRRYFFRVQDQAQIPFEKPGDHNPVRVGKYAIAQSALEFANEAIRYGATQEVLLIDEIGTLESRRKGLFNATAAALASPNAVKILVVRQDVLNHIESLFGVQYDHCLTIEYRNWEKFVAPLVDTVIGAIQRINLND